jgi:hypothetical protein
MAKKCQNQARLKMRGFMRGEPAKARFLDRTYILAINPRGAVNETHIEIIRNLARFRQNLLVLIESDAWDKVG